MALLPFIRWIMPPFRLLALGIGGIWLVGMLALTATSQTVAPTADLPPELSAAARDYRIEIYGAYRQNRSEYDQRRKQAEALLAEWQTRGALPDEADLLVRWFDNARRAATRQQPAPAAPKWNGAHDLVPQPPRSRLSPPNSANQSPQLRALPAKRQRYVQHAQFTAISTDIIRPKESARVAHILEALPAMPSLKLVLALSDSRRAYEAQYVNLPKMEAVKSLKISSNTLPLPADKLNSNTIVGATTLPAYEEKAELNTAELRARLRGYDKAWRALQADLYSEEELTLDRASALLMILQDLQQARRDLQLYQAIAPENLREEVRGLSAIEELQNQLRQVIKAARNSTLADHTLAPNDRAKLDRAWLILQEQLQQ
jgi:hypothetical protein